MLKSKSSFIQGLLCPGDEIHNQSRPSGVLGMMRDDDHDDESEWRSG